MFISAGNTAIFYGLRLYIYFYCGSRLVVRSLCGYLETETGWDIDAVFVGVLISIM